MAMLAKQTETVAEEPGICRGKWDPWLCASKGDAFPLRRGENCLPAMLAFDPSVKL